MALVRPGSALDEEHFVRAVEGFRRLGFFVALFPRKKSKQSFFAGSDEERAAELNWAFSNPGIRAIFSCRGGYGSMRLPQYWKKSDLKKWKPKLFLGYSDITFLHQWLQNELGFLGFHAPLVGQISEADLSDLIENTLALGARKSETWAECGLYRKGKARGILQGGNLAMLHTAGPAALPKRNMILALEDVNEAHYRLDRRVWELIHAGYAPYVKALILGEFYQCGKSEARRFEWSWVMETLEKLCPKGPILIKARFGHGLKRQRILPLGAEVELNGRSFRWRKPLVQN